MTENIVVKIGGATLFGESTFVESMRAMLQNATRQRLFVLLGGGETVESMRALHARYPQLDTESMHWRCVRLLDATWEIGCELFPELTPIATRAQLQQAKDGTMQETFLVRPAAFYSPESLADIPEPWRPAHDWNTTTDTISWLLAKWIKASELKIVKCCLVDSSTSLLTAARSGIIDPELARLALADQAPDRPAVRLLAVKIGE
jgi:aspartokinase-like uncharacterized kinase